MLSFFFSFLRFHRFLASSKCAYFFKIFNHRWRSLAWFHRFFGAQDHIFVKYIYKNPRKHLQNLWTSYHNFWQPKSRYRHKPDHLPPDYITMGVPLLLHCFFLLPLFSAMSTDAASYLFIYNFSLKLINEEIRTI